MMCHFSTMHNAEISERFPRPSFLGLECCYKIEEKSITIQTKKNKPVVTTKSNPAEIVLASSQFPTLRSPPDYLLGAIFQKRGSYPAHKMLDLG